MRNSSAPAVPKKFGTCTAMIASLPSENALRSFPDQVPCPACVQESFTTIAPSKRMPTPDGMDSCVHSTNAKLLRFCHSWRPEE